MHYPTSTFLASHPFPTLCNNFLCLISTETLFSLQVASSLLLKETYVSLFILPLKFQIQSTMSTRYTIFPLHSIHSIPIQLHRLIFMDRPPIKWKNKSYYTINKIKLKKHLSWTNYIKIILYIKINSVRNLICRPFAGSMGNHYQHTTSNEMTSPSTQI